MPAEFLLGLSKRLLQAPSSPAFAPTLADLQDAAAFQEFMAQMSDFDMEQVLGAVIGLFYSIELFSASPKARSDCVLHLQDADVQESQLDCFLAFGKHLLRNGLEGCWGEENDNMIEEMEKLWWDFCTIRSVEVDVNFPIRYPVLTPEDEADLFSYPFRAKQVEQRLKQHEEEIHKENANGSSSHEQPVMAFSCGSVPKFFELAHRILHSHFFLCLPLQNVGHNYRKFCEENNNAGGWEKAYSEVVQTEVVIPEDKFRGPPDCSYPLTRSQLRRLVEQLRCNGKGTLLRALLTGRPPSSTLPHLYAMVDCTIRARLWLLGIDLNIYMDSTLTYAELGSGSCEEEVYHNIYLQERVPSCVELVQRLYCHDRLCGFRGRAEEVLVLTPRDYDTLGAPDDEMWRGVREHIRHSMSIAEGEKVDPALVFQNVSGIYGPLLDVDRKWQRLHPSLGRSDLRQPFDSSPGRRVVFQRQHHPAEFEPQLKTIVAREHSEECTIEIFCLILFVVIFVFSLL